MKLKTLSIILCSILLFACTNNNNKNNLEVLINGEITNPIGTSVIFSNKDTSYTATTDEDGTFAISFMLDSATYLNFEHGVERTAMYVKPGDEIKMSIDTEQFDETISYEGSKESSFLAKLYLHVENFDFEGEVFYMVSNEEYKMILETFKEDLIEELKSIPNSTFMKNEIVKLEDNIKKWDKQQDKLSKYSQDVKNYMWETKNLAKNYNFWAALDSLNRSEYDNMINKYTNEFHTLLSEVSDSEFIIDAKERIKKTTNDWLERKYSTDNVPKEGQSAIDFTYPDKDGNNFSLASFKGNLIYVDVWATWCGPCKVEIPFLQKLEEEYHEKDITFLSVSVDTDRDAWLKMIIEKELSGTQLWADGWSEITKSYAIFGIPRFMLFSAEGNVISTNAPRPSSDEIRPLIDTHL